MGDVTFQQREPPSINAKRTVSVVVSPSARKRLTSNLYAYFDKVRSVYLTGQAREHAYRPAQISLFDSFNDILSVNDAAKSEAGYPDFLFLRSSNPEVTYGYGEGKDIAANLDRVEKTEQLLKYSAYDNLMLTNVLEYRFYASGRKGRPVVLATLKDRDIAVLPDAFDKFIDEFSNFLEKPPEKIRSASRLAESMGGKARRIRTEVEDLIATQKDNDIRGIYNLVRQTLSHDMTIDSFADMYAQTLVYGLFAARYHDSDLATFSRQEARELIAKENDFLKHFFDHIAGPDLSQNIAHIVNELCDVLRASDVRTIVHRRIAAGDNRGRDPIIYFYEEFLSQYDVDQRKKRGVYYTPTPIVRYIVESVDDVLKEDFEIRDGLADAGKKAYQIEVPTGYSTNSKKRTDEAVKQPRRTHQVQILDPAVGTATFLNETIRHIRRAFDGQDGLWPSYVNEDLLPRLFGFELMMAPYAVAHIKLSMTLAELGAPSPSSPSEILLTNTLEKPADLDHDLFTIGLASAFSDEAQRASQVKTDSPVMVVMGNPPYSGHSENKSAYAKSLVDAYKLEPGGKSKLQEQNSKWLNDDYVKFIAFAEKLIAKNADGGIMAMITNRGYLENPTFRGMRWRLTQTFDTIRIIDLHGSMKTKDEDPGGGPDESVFDIQVGVAIIIASKIGKGTGGTANVLYSDIFGTRQEKFDALEKGKFDFVEVDLDPKFYFFAPRDFSGRAQYQSGLTINSIFGKGVTGLYTGRDKLTIDIDRDSLQSRVEDFMGLEAEDARRKYDLGEDVRDWQVGTAQSDVREGHSFERVIPITYRPFDVRWTYYTGTTRGFYYYPRTDVMRDLRDDSTNMAIIVGRQGAATGAGEWTVSYVGRHVIDLNVFSRGGGFVFPRRVRDKSGVWVSNVLPGAVKLFADAVGSQPTDDDVFDYVYGVLSSPIYRSEGREFLKSDFPVIPLPTDADDFYRHSEFGGRIRDIHLLEHPGAQSSSSFVTSFPQGGSNEIMRRHYDEETGRLWINEDQYFGNVSSSVWEYRIGGYQVSDKWLKDRRGRALSSLELRQFQAILSAAAAAIDVTRRFVEG